jgi:hypothetical protein
LLTLKKSKIPCFSVTRGFLGSTRGIRGNFDAEEPFCLKKYVLFYKKPHLSMGLFVACGSRYGTADSAECVADLGSKQAHNSDHNQRDHGENYRVFNQALAFLLGSA